MKITVALKSVSLLAFDTTPIIYFIENNPTYIARMRQIMNQVAQGDVKGTISYLTLTEVLVHPLRSGNKALAKQYEQVLGQSNHFSLVPVSREVATKAAELRAAHNLKTPDALHVASAIVSKADAFLTNDKGIKRVNEIDILLVDDLEL